MPGLRLHLLTVLCLLSLLPADRVRLRFFVPEPAVAAYRVGAEIGFACDGCPPDLRARIASGRPWQHLVPGAVAAYILSEGLYGDAADTASSL